MAEKCMLIARCLSYKIVLNILNLILYECVQKANLRQEQNISCLAKMLNNIMVSSISG